MVKGGELKLLTNTDESECRYKNNGICADKKIINNISKYFINITDKFDEHSDNKKLDILKKKLNCQTESCILVKSANDGIIERDVVDKELRKKFKIKGPRETNDLLSNYNIDQTMLILTSNNKGFYPCEFAMIDFYDYKCGLSEIKLDSLVNGKKKLTNYVDNTIINGPFDTFACVLNTDTSNGKGKHWICLFVDMRGKTWTIEFFNSSGNAPHINIVRWMESQRSLLMPINKNTIITKSSNITHQKDNFSCGTYVLYYIKARLDMVPYTYFLNNKIIDDYPVRFRKHIFREY